MGYRNIVLIGAPGCGKTTIGKLLALRMNVEFFDIDEYIEKKSGKSIKDIFKQGEGYFRKIEHEALSEIAEINRKKVISTGGGVVKLYENMKILSSNSVIIFINRPVEQIVSDIDISTRPLLYDNKSRIYELFEERYPLYKKYCDYEVANNKCIEDVLDEIIQILR